MTGDKLARELIYHLYAKYDISVPLTIQEFIEILQSILDEEEE